MPARYRGRVGGGRLVRVEWYPSVVADMTTRIPAKAHEIAIVTAAKAAGAKARGRGTGALSRDVSNPKRLGPLAADIGSDLPYARIQHYGGVISAKNAEYLMIHSPRRGSSGRFQSSNIVARKRQVTIRGKRYLDEAGPTYKRVIGGALDALYRG